jgi:hypothetical protein
VGRRELLRWVNRTVGVEYVQVESCADGVALAQLVDAAYPDARVPLYRLDFATRHEHDRARNLEVVRATLDRLDLDVPLDVKEVSRGAYRACDEALRWLYLVVQRERPRSATRGYDGRARRLEALEKRRYLARAPSKSPGWRSAASWDDGSGGDSSRAATSSAATAKDPDGDAPFSFSFRPRLSMDDGVVYSDEGSDGGRGLAMSVDSLDGPGEEDDQKTFSRAAARKETSRREKRTPLASVSVGNGKHKATTGAGAGAGPAVVRPATAPFARRRSTVSVVASARVDISPEPEPDPRRSPREEAEAEPSSGDENRSYRSSRPRTPFVALSSLSPRPSSARLYTPRRSLDKWAEKARLRLESRESRERSSPRAFDADVPAFRTSRDSEPRGRERRRAYEDASSSSSSSVASDEPDAFGAFSSFTNWTASPPGSAERAARLRREARAQALARTPRDAVQTTGRSVEESTTRARMARAEVAEIKAREAARRRRKEAERRARLEAEAEAEARAAEERRLELEAEEAARYAREVASARLLQSHLAPRAEAQGGEGGFAAGGADFGRGAGFDGFRTGSVFVFGGVYDGGRRRAVSVGRGHGAGGAREETRRLGVAGGIPEVGTRGGAEAVRGGEAGHGGGGSRAGRRDSQARHRGDEAAAGGARTERELTAKNTSKRTRVRSDVRERLLTP